MSSIDFSSSWTGLYPDELLWKDIISPCVLITGSSSLLRLDRCKSNPWDAISSLIERLQLQGFSVCLYAADLNDSPLFRHAAIKHGACFMSASTPTNVVLSVMKKCCAMISGRWHASILASTVGLPSILGVANFYKTSYLNQLFFQDSFPLFDYACLTPDLCDSLVNRVVAFSTEQKYKLLMTDVSIAQSSLFEDSISSMVL